MDNGIISHGQDSYVVWKVKKQSHRGRAETRSGTTLVEGQGACTVWETGRESILGGRVSLMPPLLW